MSVFDFTGWFRFPHLNGEPSIAFDTEPRFSLREAPRLDDVPTTANDERSTEDVVRFRRMVLATLRGGRDAVRLTARCLDAIHDAASGHMCDLCGDTTAVRYRKRVSGEEAFPLESLAYLITCGHPAGRRAAHAAISLLADALDYDLFPRWASLTPDEALRHAERSLRDLRRFVEGR